MRIKQYTDLACLGPVCACLEHLPIGSLMAMEFVGQYLQGEAFARTEAGEKDVFARSSFNRYYYAAFLETRKMMTSLRPEWGKLAHKNIPEVLRASVQPEFKKANMRAQRTGDKDAIHACSMAILAAKNLADLLEQSYTIRVVADYKSETPIVFDASANFTLNAISITTARQWPSKAKGFSQSISSGWRQANVFA